MATHTWKLTSELTTGNGVDRKLLQSYVVTGDYEILSDITVAAAASNVAYNLPIDISRIESVLIQSDAAMTILTNSTGSPTDTITLAASNDFTVRYSTAAGDSATNPFSGDVTVLYVSSTPGGTLKLRLLMDKDDS